jgi:outer membrane protein OmpA-like peptidoglycan-associated protein
MKRVLLVLAFHAGSWFPAGTVRGQAPPDSAAIQPPRPGLIPVRLRHDGVRIRSVHDARRTVIVRPVVRVILPGPAPRPAGTGEELAAMERRLMDYLDRRLSIVESRLAASGTASSPPAVVIVPRGSERTTTVLPVPGVPVPVDTGVVDSFGVAVAVADSADTTASTAPLFVVDPTTSVMELERAILDQDLLRTTSVVFEFNRAEIMPASASVLNTLGIVLQRHPGVRLEVAGHTDAQGPDEYNLQLSLRRANAVRDYLLGNYTIDPTRLIARGYGETRPIADDATATGRAMNRRVEFVPLR